MKLALSQGVERTFPQLTDLIHSVWGMARALDPDIPFEGVYLEARCGRPSHISGWAYPLTSTHDARWGRDRTIYHPHGAVELIIGTRNEWAEIVRLCAHEFRHLGQYQRGWRHYGYLTSDPMTREDSEQDAYSFEETVWERFRSLADHFAFVTASDVGTH